MSTRTLRTFAGALLGILLLQAAWALVVPPFTGVDEYGHVFKAAAVARGQWGASSSYNSGGDGLVSVPPDLVAAARPVCQSFVYSTNDHCATRPSSGPGLVQVGSSASSYNPLFYAVIGGAARPFHGVGALYVMRLAAALLCALLLAAGITVGVSSARSPLQVAAMYLTLTPVTIYSTAVVAPNGVELAGAFLTWVALLAAVRCDPDDSRLVRYVQLAALGAVPLAVVRALGPLWLALIVLTCLALATRAQLRTVVTSRAVWLSLPPVVAATVFGVLWTHQQHLTSSATPGGTGHATWPSVWDQLPKEYFFWVLQSMGAFPSRVDFAPLALYALLGVTLWILIAMAVRLATGRERLVLLAVWAISSAIPMAFLVRTYADQGPVWQGRYGYPYAMGALLLCSAVIGRARVRRNAQLPVLGLGCAVFGAAELIGLLHVLAHERAASPLFGSSEWPAPSAAVVVVLVGLGVAALAYVGRSTCSARVDVSRQAPTTSGDALPRSQEAARAW